MAEREQEAKENRRIIHVHPPVMGLEDLGVILNTWRMKLKGNRRVVLYECEDAYILVFKRLTGRKVMKTTIPLSREAMAALVSIYDGALTSLRRNEDLLLLAEQYVPLRRADLASVATVNASLTDDA